MPLLHTLYPVGLAAANIAVGWLLYGVLDTSLGAVLVPVGGFILLAVVLEKVQPATRRSSTLPHGLSRSSSEDPPVEHRR